LTNTHSDSIIVSTLSKDNPMSVSYLNAQKSRYRITLELDVQNDFNPHQVNWDKLFDLEDNESVESYVEELDIPDSW